MSHQSVTVFVRRIGGSFHANTLQADALHRTSATVAARMCAARHLGVDEREIEVIPEGDHVMIATIRTQARVADRPMLIPALVCLEIGAAALVYIWKGHGS